MRQFPALALFEPPQVGDDASFEWRDAFVRSFLGRDMPQFGFRFPAATLQRFWTMLAHWHGQL